MGRRPPRVDAMSSLAPAPHASPPVRSLGPPRVVDLGRLSYADGCAAQTRAHAEVLAAREDPSPTSRAPGVILLVEHDPPVITVSRRPGARDNLLATPAMLASLGVEVAETDRGGDITYHGPGQLVVYPIVDLNALGWSLHRYMRELEGAVIRACARWGVEGRRDPSATGVWIGGAKVCAMGVRVRRWVTTHGLALNVAPDLGHFDLIVPCGLAGRPVTSLARELGDASPTMDVVKAAVVEELRAAMVGAPESPRA